MQTLGVDLAFRRPAGRNAAWIPAFAGMSGLELGAY